MYNKYLLHFSFSVNVGNLFVKTFCEVFLNNIYDIFNIAFALSIVEIKKAISYRITAGYLFWLLLQTASIFLVP